MDWGNLKETLFRAHYLVQKTLRVLVIQINHTLLNRMALFITVCLYTLPLFFNITLYQLVTKYIQRKKEKKINQIHASIWILLRRIPYLFCELISFIFLVKNFAKNKSERQREMIQEKKNNQTPKELELSVSAQIKG